MTDAHEVMRHFAGTLRMGTLDTVMFDDSAPHVRVPREEIIGGRLSDESVEALLADRAAPAERRRTERKDRRGPRATGTRAEAETGAEAAVDADDDQADSSISVAIALAAVPQGAGHAGIVLLEAKLSEDGRLEPVLEPGRSPWVPAERLEIPGATPLDAMVGPLRSFWTHARDAMPSEISRADDVADAVAIAERMAEAISGKSLERFAEDLAADGIHVEHEHCLVRKLERINAVSGLLGAYDHLDRAGAPPLVDRLIAGHPGPREPETTIHHGIGLAQAARSSCGSMTDGHPLADSQRRAVHAFLRSEEGEITAVSGPPGTGKTTMLQSVVANLVTRRALERAPAPVIVGTSTNNQAVQNIISSFASVAKDEHGPLDARWLPMAAKKGALPEEPLRSLAVYCPSQAKLEEAIRDGFLVEQPRKDRTYAAYSEKEYLREAEGVFIDRVFACFGSISDLPGVAALIHEALAEIDALRLAALDAMTEDGPGDRFRAICSDLADHPVLAHVGGVPDLQTCEDLVALDQKLDTTVRYAEFWLAVHWFEAQWLLFEGEHLSKDDRGKNTERFFRTYWEQAPALTPCFVMTAYQVPKYFTMWDPEGRSTTYATERIDLLIVDEAGQVDTPIALPALAMASRALVVGDVKQLAPVWSLDEETDREISIGEGIDARTWDEELRPRGLTCSRPSSLMRAASHASRWQYGDAEPGLFLSEHFRCHPDIIGMCNELLYDGLLQPRRPASRSKLAGRMPAFQFRTVPGSQDSSQGGSRVNQAEAKAIATWILENFERFFTIYHHDVEDPNDRVKDTDLIGVVTPFRAQADLIRRELRRAAEAPDAPSGLPPRLWRKITVGTAHALQGAERPIILFSAVYGEGSGSASFIDQNTELMNVAVSRAKDLLIVFAAAQRWDNGPVFSVMAHHAQRVDGPSAAPADEQAVAPDTCAPAAPAPSSVPVSAVLARWRDAGELREEDLPLKPVDLNLRLRDAGVLVGEPGSWRPTPLASRLGLLSEERTGKDGSAYLALSYTASMQELLLRLYRDGKL